MNGNGWVSLAQDVIDFHVHRPRSVKEREKAERKAEKLRASVEALRFMPAEKRVHKAELDAIIAGQRTAAGSVRKASKKKATKGDRFLHSVKSAHGALLHAHAQLPAKHQDADLLLAFKKKDSNYALADEPRSVSAAIPRASAPPTPVSDAALGRGRTPLSRRMAEARRAPAGTEERVSSRQLRP